MKKLYLLAIVFLLMPFASSAGDEKVAKASHELLSDGVKKNVRENFWGKAKGKNGEILEPKSDNDMSFLVPESLENEVIHIGTIAGGSEWCDLDGQKLFVALIKREQKNKVWDVPQTAYISRLFAMSMYVTMNGMKARGACQEADKEMAHQVFGYVLETLQDGKNVSIKKSLDSTQTEQAAEDLKKMHKTVTEMAQKHFWSQLAKDYNGNPIKPQNNNDKSYLVPEKLEYEAISVGNLAGAMTWCRMDPVMLLISLTEKVRKAQTYSEQQIAYVRGIYAISAGLYEKNSKIELGICDDQHRQSVKDTSNKTLTSYKEGKEIQ